MKRGGSWAAYDVYKGQSQGGWQGQPKDGGGLGLVCFLGSGASRVQGLAGDCGRPLVPFTLFPNSAVLPLIHISDPTRLGRTSYAVFCLKKKKTPSV